MNHQDAPVLDDEDLQAWVQYFKLLAEIDKNESKTIGN
jgi:hypothetical protein